MCAALLGVVLKSMEYGKWLVIGLVCFGQSLMTFAEKFWWLWGKYVLVFLLISIFDFTPDLMAFVGYFIGNILLSLPALFFKDIDILHYLNLEFQYSMVQSTTATNNTLSISLGFILVFGFLGLATFKHKDL